MNFEQINKSPLGKACVGDAVRVKREVGIVYGADPIYGARVAVKRFGKWKHFDDVSWFEADVDVLGMPEHAAAVACGEAMGYRWAEVLKADKAGWDAKRAARPYNGRF